MISHWIRTCSWLRVRLTIAHSEVLMAIVYESSLVSARVDTSDVLCRGGWILVQDKSRT